MADSTEAQTAVHWREEDGAVQAADGYYRILGRVDDVINVAGHRLGTKELESATLTVDEVAEAAAVPVVDEVRGRAVEMYVSLKPGLTPGEEIENKVVAAIETEIGKIARPKNVWIVPDMPKTRSGKIMRRVIAAVPQSRGWRGWARRPHRRSWGTRSGTVCRPGSRHVARPHAS